MTFPDLELSFDGIGIHRRADKDGASGDCLAVVFGGDRDLARLFAASKGLFAACEAAVGLEGAIDREAWYASASIPDVFRQLKAALAAVRG
jgi:hypothetical protein